MWKVSKYGVFLVRIFLYFDWIQENTDQKNLRIWTLFTQCIDLIKSLVLVHLQAMKQYWQQILWRFWDVVADYNLWHSSISTFVVSGIAYRHLILQFSVLFIMSLNYVNWKLKMAKQIYQMNEQNQVLGVNFFGFSRLQRSFLPNQTLIQWNLYKADTIGAKKCEL